MEEQPHEPPDPVKDEMEDTNESESKPILFSAEDDEDAEEDTNENILLGGEDAMEEEEDEDEALPSIETSALPESNELISRIITPSPYPHHNSGPTSSRFRNALGRVTTNPESDVEAWQALITEVGTCYREILPSLHSVDADKHAKLDWMESCYGTFLKHFPYASNYYVTIVEMLLSQSARHGEQDGPLLDVGIDNINSQRARKCDAKVDNIFRRVLGFNVDGTKVDEQRNNIMAMCTSSVELWLLYIRKCVRDANRTASTMPPADRPKFIRDRTVQAHEVAIQNASFVYNNHLLWKQYLAYVKAWIPDPANNTDTALKQQQMVQLRSIYQRLVTHPMTGLDQLWQEYEAFERSQSEALAQALFSEYTPKYQHARTVYLERNRVYNVVDLQLGRLAIPPVNVADEDYAAKMEEEQKLLTMWKTRTSYERTNPERLSPVDLAQRVRHAYKEMVCVLARHPEVWHMWSMWELLGSGAYKERGRLDCAVAVLQLAQQHIPDCTLLAYSEAHIIETHSDMANESMLVMEKFLERNPNTLGFVLYQQMARRYKGINAARAVFAKARRVLCESTSLRTDRDKDPSQKTSDVAAETAEGEAAAATSSGGGNNDENGKRWMVTNRLDPGVGVMGVGSGTDAVKRKSSSAENSQRGQNGALEDSDEPTAQSKPLPITWHLYASHANIEHRLNGSPEVAARVYELGLRKHSSFLTKPPYVLRYAQLLLELQDTVNLRALLTRAVAACESQEGKGDTVAALWDMTLRFESLLSSSDASNIPSLVDVERRRRAALMGEDVEDVATGGFVGVGDTAVGIGAQKSSIAEQLIRADGYDVSSNIVNGMSRSVDVLDVMGLWGSGDSLGTNSRLRIQQILKGDNDEEISGGKSDASYQRRLKFQTMAAVGLSSGQVLSDGITTGTKVLTARERLQQGGGGAMANQAQTSAVNLAIQQQPEWIRPLLLMLPASQMRLGALSKPPPHLTEMALLALRQNSLPAERPSGDSKLGVLVGSKRKMDNGGDSSDEEIGMGSGGGYGAQFRARQRARQMRTSGEQNGVVDQVKP